MSVQKDSNAVIDYGDLSVTGGVSVFSEEFDSTFYYEGTDLGLTYTKEKSSFRVWAPTASEAFVMLYEAWDSSFAHKIPMKRDVKGTWVSSIEGDLSGRYYTYLVRIGKQWNEAVDPYAKAVGVNGDRGAIIDMSETNPERWTADQPEFINAMDAIIYELHIRDYTIHAESGVKNKGKYLGLAETGTRGPEGINTGLDHIKDLGVTHVQVMPFYDFATESIDETRLDEPQYNWGYDPKNYNVPEGSYSTDPYRPETRIRELKQMIQAMHDEGLRVIMDVVYNHVFDGYLINFTKLVPGYYLRYTADRQLSNGSGCGNDTASERKMMRKFIVESILYWAGEYNIDGFRFDLMGLLDKETMNEIRHRLDEVDPSIIMLGEGWIMETELAKDLRANQLQAKEMPRIAHFNDGFRNTVKGDVFVADKKGFISGGTSLETEMKKAIAAGIQYNSEITSFAIEPDQTVNYVECHDNHTLWDKIELSTMGENNEVRQAMHRLASSILLTSQGIPFIHAGQEFYRSKGGEENSYNLSDEVNQLDWKRAAEHRDAIQFMKQLIKLRHEHPAFRMKDAASIRTHLVFEEAPQHAVAYSIRNHANGDPEKHLYVLHYAGRSAAQVNLPNLGSWEILFGKEFVEQYNDSIIRVNGIGTVVLGCRD
ncbi:type I pullulanase [Paenibacillus dakarensis]|uniref:type I pullulanase n=1 Tax=Paenibacillus dakarensis TaxID=1527293 RepID=UPI0006D54D22|nr:type I pullulanase [Paenibacillus dakarensis]